MAVFFFCIVMKIRVLTEEVDYVISGQLRGKYGFDVLLVTGGMVASIVGSLILTAVVAAQQVVKAANKPTFRLLSTKAPPALPLAKGHKWHLFLSHIWGTGQDQCATIKRQLCLLLPGASIFLDVDDLEDIGKLEEYVEATGVIMIFVSGGYFKSRNCLREAKCTLEKRKPIVLVHDPGKSLIPLETIQAEECPEAHEGATMRGPNPNPNPDPNPDPNPNPGPNPGRRAAAVPRSSPGARARARARAARSASPSRRRSTAGWCPASPA